MRADARLLPRDSRSFRLRGSGKLRAGRFILPAFFCLAGFTGRVPAQHVAEPGAVASGQPNGTSQARALLLYARVVETERTRGPAAALPLCRELLALPGMAGTLPLRVAGIFEAAGEPDEALRLLDAAVKARTDDPEPLLTLSRFCSRTAEATPERRARAMQAARQAVERFPRHAESITHLLRLLITDGLRKDAQDLATKAAAAAENDPAYWLTLARSMRDVFPLDDVNTREAHLARCLAPWEKAATLATDDAAVQEAAADGFAALRQSARALPLYSRAVQLAPGRLEARRKLGQCQRLAGDMAGARRTFTALLEINPADAVAHRALAAMDEADGNTKEALRHRTELLRLEGGEPDDYRKLIERLMAASLTAEARLTAERGRHHHPGDPGLVLAHAEVLMAEGRPREALPLFTETTRLAAAAQPDLIDDRFICLWGDCARAVGDTDQAAAHYRRAVKEAPAKDRTRAASATAGLVLTWLDAGDRLPEAAELLRSAAKQAPDNPRVREAAARLKAMQGDWSGSLPTLTELATAPGVSAGLLRTLAEAQWRTGAKDAARRTMDRALALPAAREAWRTERDRWQKSPPP